MIYDLAVIGNGLAAQTFLWTLAKHPQTISIVHIACEKMAPSCGLRSSATASLNGIEAGVSGLGNDMREAFFLFDQLVKNDRPEGVEEVPRTVVATNLKDVQKITRRYKKLSTQSSPLLKEEHPGVLYPSYLIEPEIFSLWLAKNTKLNKTDLPFFVTHAEKKEGVHEIVLQNAQVLKARKVLWATGAYAKIFEPFYFPSSLNLESKNVIKSGSFLERAVDLGEKSFYLTIDGHQILYKVGPQGKKLSIGTVSTLGAYEAQDVKALHDLWKKFRALVTFDLGDWEDFKVVTGLRHKGPKRLLICEAVDEEKTMFRINGLYKNGFTLSFLAAERMKRLMFSQ